MSVILTSHLRTAVSSSSVLPVCSSAASHELNLAQETRKRRQHPAFQVARWLEVEWLCCHDSLAGESGGTEGRSKGLQLSVCLWEGGRRGWFACSCVRPSFQQCSHDLRHLFWQRIIAKPPSIKKKISYMQETSVVVVWSLDVRIHMTIFLRVSPFISVNLLCWALSSSLCNFSVTIPGGFVHRQQ